MLLFEEYYNLTLIEEGLFELPSTVYKEVVNFYIKNITKYLKQKKPRVNYVTYPPKTFEINFSNSKYEFLNNLEPKPTVEVFFTDTQSSSFTDMSYSTGKNTIEERNKGTIVFRLSDDPNFNEKHILYIVEHEMMHFVQSLIKKYKNLNRLGGMPDKSISDNNLTMHGKPINNPENYELDEYGVVANHSHIPCEYYPDLLSAVRELQSIYIRQNKFDNKKDFYKHFLSVVDANKVGGLKCVDIFKAFKELGNDFYRNVLKISYDALVNGEIDTNILPDTYKDKPSKKVK